MSKGNNPNDNLNDYLNLLDEYSDKEKNGFKIIRENYKLEETDKNDVDSDTMRSKKINKDFSYLSDMDFFNDYVDDSEDLEVDDDGFPEDEAKNQQENAGKNKINDVEIDFSLFEEDGESVNRDIPAPPPMVNSPSSESNNKIVKWYKNLSKNKQITIKVISIILAVILTFTVIVGIFISTKLGLLGDKVVVEEEEEQIYEESDVKDIVIDIGSEGFKQALEDWAKTGNDRHMSSKNVINVLLIGADSRSNKNAGNTDVMMLLSLNLKTKKLKLISFFRDSYLFIDGKRNSYCNKLNAAFSMGGPKTLLQTIENNYKIDIDNYVMVNFKSFEAIIDAMGGVQVDVKQYEADYNNRKFKTKLPVGEGVTLNGKQALCFCRIRHCDADGDVSRTRRQRQVIDSIVNRVNSASISELNKYIDVLLPYVDTGYSKSKILSLGVKALTGGWAKYERTELQMPPEDCRTSGSANMWIWVVDYQKAAHDLQMEIYGKSNIVLSEDRVTIIDIYKGAHYSGDGNNISSNNSNNKNNVPKTTEKISTTAPRVTEIIETTEKKPDVSVTEITENEIENETTKVEVTEEQNTEQETEPDVTENGIIF